MKRDVMWLCGLLLFPLSQSHASDAPEPSVLSISGVLVDGPWCEVSNGKTIEVSFDKVGLNKVATGEVRKEIPYTIDCEEGDSTGYVMTLMVYGSAADFDSDNATVVSAANPDLGVKLYADGVPFRLNKYINVSASGSTKLEASLIQRPGAELETGGFSATATLRAMYQ